MSCVHSEAKVAAAVPEPVDGAMLVVEVVGITGIERKVVWRDDVEAKSWGGPEAERWFDGAGDDGPMELYQHLKYAERVHEVAGRSIELGKR